MARWLIGSVCAFLVIAISLPASAQQGQQIFGFILDQAAREIERQEFRQQQRRQQQYNRQQHQQFAASWQACFQGEVTACDQALGYSNLNGTDRSRLMTRRNQILAARREAAAQVEQQRMEAAFQERQRQLEDERRRERELVRQREEAERLRREREVEERRLAELRAYAGHRDACRRYDTAACSRALNSDHAAADVADLRHWRDIAQHYHAERTGCQGGSLVACDAALASPALASVDRDLLNHWREAAHPWHRTLAAISAAPAALLDLPASTQIVGGIAMVLAFALVGVAYRRRTHETGERSDSEDGTPTPEVNEPTAANATPVTTTTNRWRQRFGEFMKSLSTLAQTSANPEPATTEPEPARMESAPAAPPTIRDTPAALAAMELTHAYITEVGDAPRPAHDDNAMRRNHLNTLSLAAKQLDLAQANDPDAILEIAGDGDATLRFSIPELKARALILEGMTHQTYDTKRAVPALRHATELDPENPSAFYILGMVHAANMNRSAAIAAFQRAVDLDPGDLDYRKELNRAQNLGTGEIAAYKATRAGERIFDAGIRTANAGIMTWNIFATIWNVVTFPLRIMIRIMLYIIRVA